MDSDGFVMKISKTKIDKAGRALSKDSETDVERYISYVEAFDNYRKQHLQPLSKTTIELQKWLSSFDKDYLIAQRLKRKPQILRKLKRFSVRLSQLQDIGGARIVVDQNSDVNEILAHLRSQFKSNKEIKIIRETDYRDRGRDDSGYRAFHLILEREGCKVELQIRSKIQHYWAETIERTSVVYGHYIKELEGDPVVIEYFKTLSDLFYEIESGRKPDGGLRTKLESLRLESEKIIESVDTKNLVSSFVNEGIIKDLIRKEKSSRTNGIQNWIIVFSWESGQFVTWELVTNDPEGAISRYVEFEEIFKSENGYEVVLVGSSQVKTLRQTHSHYFGLGRMDGPILEDLNSSIVGFSNKMDLDVGARDILRTLDRKRYWGSKSVSIETLKNHFCKDIFTFDSSFKELIKREFILERGRVSLNLKKKKLIEKYL